MGSIGYLVMEFIEGTTLDNLDKETKSVLSVRIARCLQHVWQIPVPANTPPEATQTVVRVQSSKHSQMWRTGST